jgi:hypothetical protein
MTAAQIGCPALEPRVACPCVILARAQVDGRISRARMRLEWWRHTCRRPIDPYAETDRIERVSP